MVPSGDGDRRRAVEEFLGVVATALNERSIDPIQRGFLQNQVGKLLGLRTDQVERQLRMIASRARTSSVEEARETRVGLSLLKDGRQAALREILTVLLNAPDRYAAVDDIFDPAAIADPTDRRIAQATVELIESNEGFEITRLIGRFADTDCVESHYRVALPRRGSRKL